MTPLTKAALGAGVVLAAVLLLWRSRAVQPRSPDPSLIPGGTGWSCFHSGDESTCFRSSTDCEELLSGWHRDNPKTYPDEHCSAISPAYCFTRPGGTIDFACKMTLAQCEAKSALWNHTLFASRASTCLEVR